MLVVQVSQWLDVIPDLLDDNEEGKADLLEAVRYGALWNGIELTVGMRGLLGNCADKLAEFLEKNMDTVGKRVRAGHLPTAASADGQAIQAR